jgi:hypothetical protein
MGGGDRSNTAYLVGAVGDLQTDVPVELPPTTKKIHDRIKVATFPSSSAWAWSPSTVLIFIVGWRNGAVLFRRQGERIPQVWPPTNHHKRGGLGGIRPGVHRWPSRIHAA